MDLAVGGTSGWFPDSVSDKPWFDGSLTAMRDFAAAKATWSATWPSAASDRAMRVWVFFDILRHHVLIPFLGTL